MLTNLGECDLIIDEKPVEGAPVLWDPWQDYYAWDESLDREAGDARQIPPPWSAPLPPFRDPQDWTGGIELVETDETRGYLLPGSDGSNLLSIDRRVEQQAHMMVHAATQAHDESHGEASHPHCPRCDVRLLRSPYLDGDALHAEAELRWQQSPHDDLPPAGTYDEALLRNARADCTARARGYAMRPPAHLTP